jgi:hypothetical protein
MAFLLNGYPQSCPANIPVTINTNPDTYYPGLTATLNTGAKTITLGAAGAGSTPIGTGDLLLVIQMQGAQINSSNSNSYGDGNSGGASSGYLSNTALMAGTMEYVVAASAVPLTGGTVMLRTGIVKKYKNAAFGVDGQYKYQVIRVAIYYNLTFGANIMAAPWNGSTGGVLVMSVTNALNFNGKRISAAAAGFRGGGARQLNGGSGGVYTDLVTLSTQNYNASKAEGIAGTPRYINYNGSLVDNGSANEGYPNGSYAAGAPGNAGGGATDGNPGTNDQNAGGGGGANGGLGGKGGNSWSSNLPSGGEAGGRFIENSASRLVMGGGGGAGTTNNGTGLFALGLSSSGAAGGGIVLLTANTITGTGTIDVSGEDANLTVLNDGSGGGGAGGSALLFSGGIMTGITVTANGGSGGTNTGTGSPHGPGGGGGGGVIYSSSNINAASSVAGGAAGYTAGTNHYNAAPGNTGVLVQNISSSQTPPQFLYCSLLPVHFVSLAAAWQQKNIVVSWDVSNESAVKEYVVEKSLDGKAFAATGVAAFNNETTALNHYSYTDTKPGSGSVVIYYRIKEVSDNGSIVYSNVISIREAVSADAGITISPNPATRSSASVHIMNKQSSSLQLLRLVSLSGNTVWQKQYNLFAGSQVIQIDNLEALPNGSYFLQYYNGIETVTSKMLINH